MTNTVNQSFLSHLKEKGQLSLAEMDSFIQGKLFYVKTLIRYFEKQKFSNTVMDSEITQWCNVLKLQTTLIESTSKLVIFSSASYNFSKAEEQLLLLNKYEKLIKDSTLITQKINNVINSLEENVKKEIIGKITTIQKIANELSVISNDLKDVFQVMTIQGQVNLES